MDAGRIVFKPVEERDYDLAELLSGISKHDLHSEVDLGGKVGKEVW